ncbi:MAG: AMMECR1 domain-containing protein, partial [Candidatus Gracilibacteria bacterium]
MISTAKQTIDFYLKHFKTPKIEELEIKDNSLLENKGSVFITIYKKGEIRGSSGNIKEIKNTLAEEIIENTIGAISTDSRFKPIKLNEAKELKIRIDIIVNRKILGDKELLQIDPTKFGVLAIKKDYNSMAVILPNINPLLLTGEDLIPI